jgi:hypothetical protein
MPLILARTRLEAAFEALLREGPQKADFFAIRRCHARLSAAEGVRTAYSARYASVYMVFTSTAS